MMPVMPYADGSIIDIAKPSKPHISLRTSGHCYVAFGSGPTASFASIRTAQAHLMPAYINQTAKELGIWRDSPSDEREHMLKANKDLIEMWGRPTAA